MHAQSIAPRCHARSIAPCRPARPIAPCRPQEARARTHCPERTPASSAGSLQAHTSARTDGHHVRNPIAARDAPSARPVTRRDAPISGCLHRYADPEPTSRRSRVRRWRARPHGQAPRPARYECLSEWLVARCLDGDKHQSVHAAARDHPARARARSRLFRSRCRSGAGEKPYPAIARRSCAWPFHSRCRGVRAIAPNPDAPGRPANDPGRRARPAFGSGAGPRAVRMPEDRPPSLVWSPPRFASAPACLPAACAMPANRSPRPADRRAKNYSDAVP